jgi:hypothetical protein
MTAPKHATIPAASHAATILSLREAGAVAMFSIARASNAIKARFALAADHTGCG